MWRCSRQSASSCPLHRSSRTQPQVGLAVDHACALQTACACTLPVAMGPWTGPLRRGSRRPGAAAGTARPRLPWGALAAMLAVWAVFSSLQLCKSRIPRCSFAYLGIVAAQLGSMLAVGSFMAVKVPHHGWPAGLREQQGTCEHGCHVGGQCVPAPASRPE